MDGFNSRLLEEHREFFICFVQLGVVAEAYSKLWEKERGWGDGAFTVTSVHCIL